MTAPEAEKTTQKQTQALLDSGRLTLKNNKYSLDLTGGCPSLKDNKCSIHVSTRRPQACSDYPLFTRETNGKKQVFASPSCTAVQAGKLYPYLRRLKNNGYEIIEAENMVSLNLHVFER